MVEQDDCQEAFRTTRLGEKFKLHDTFMCAGGQVRKRKYHLISLWYRVGKTDCEFPQGRKDTCKGDGGGPLMCASSSDASVFIQAGITAWGINCGTDGIPGAYASVTKAVCFIKWTTQCFYGKRWEGSLQFNKRPKKIQISFLNKLKVQRHVRHWQLRRLH